MVADSSMGIKTCSKRPPLPNRCASAERASITSLPSTQIHNQQKLNNKMPSESLQNQPICSTNSSHSQRCSSLDRSANSVKSDMPPSAKGSKRVIHVNYPSSNGLKSYSSPNHYAVPKRSSDISQQPPSLPDFHEEKQDMGMNNIIILVDIGGFC